MNAPVATFDSWKTEPFGECREIPYTEAFTVEETTRLKSGLIPEGMEDKWFVFFEGQTLFFYRSWMGLPVYKLVLIETDGAARVFKALMEESLLKQGDPVYQASLLGWLVSNLLLDKQAPYPSIKNSQPV